MQVGVLGRYNRLEPAPARAQPVSGNRKPRNKPGEALSRRWIEPWKRRRVNCGESYVDKVTRGLDTDIASDRMRQSGRFELVRWAAVMARYCAEQRIAAALGAPVDKQAVYAPCQCATEKGIALIIVEAGQPAGKIAERRRPQLLDLRLKRTSKLSHIVKGQQCCQGCRGYSNGGSKFSQEHSSRGSHVETVTRYAVHRRWLALSTGFRPEFKW